MNSDEYRCERDRIESYHWRFLGEEEKLALEMLVRAKAVMEVIEHSDQVAVTCYAE
jgi:hypothetical protein